DAGAPVAARGVASGTVGAARNVVEVREAAPLAEPARCRIEVEGVDEGPAGVAVVEPAPIRRPGQTIRNPEARSQPLDDAVCRHAVEGAHGLLLGPVVHAADVKAAIRPDLAVVEAVGFRFRY